MKGIKGIKYQGKFAPPEKRVVNKLTIIATEIGKYSFLVMISAKHINPPIHHPSKGKFKIPTSVAETKKFNDPTKPLSIA